MTNKTWHEMSAKERLCAKVGYFEYGYGGDHPLTLAARAGDIEAFRRAATHITEMDDTCVVAICDARA